MPLAVIVVFIFKLQFIGQMYPTFASLNNGTLLCESCANIHKSFSEVFSVVKTLSEAADLPTNYLYLYNGGNANFIPFLQSYELFQENSEVKYKSKAAEFYRQRVIKII